MFLVGMARSRQTSSPVPIRLPPSISRRLSPPPPSGLEGHTQHVHPILVILGLTASIRSMIARWSATKGFLFEFRARS